MSSFFNRYVNLNYLFFSGNEFKLADFHYAVLKNGAMPLRILETTIDEWISSVQQDQSSKTTNTISKASYAVCDIFVLLIGFGLKILMSM